MSSRRFRLAFATLLAVPALAGALRASAAQPGISLYGAVVGPDQNASLGYSMPAGWATFDLDRVEDPTAALTRGNAHQPRFDAGAGFARVRSVRQRVPREGYGEVNFGRLPSGVYRLSAREGNASASTALVVTRLGVVVKRAKNGLLVYAADRLTGQPRAANVYVAGKAAGTTGPDGLLRVTSPATTDALAVAARSGRDWSLADAYWNTWAASRYTGFVYTDRPVYRPGDEIQARGTLRDAQTLRPPAAQDVTARLLDPQDKELARATERSDAYGTFTASFAVPASAASGQYRVEATTGALQTGTWEGRETYSASLYVQPYVKPEYRVDLSASAPRAVQGDSVTVTARATYLAGGNVSGGHGTLYVTRGAYYPSWPGEGDETLATTLPPGQGADYGSDLIVQKAVTLDANGEAHIALKLDPSPDGQPQRYRMGLDVTDEAGQVVTGALDVIAYPAAVTVNVATDGYAYR
ncbi:MAG TPA: MG2 domain-containing protein, partial [Deinococcales bacterium]|nr:MG2 domain-containing protein [Deinococcales bacterium]